MQRDTVPTGENKFCPKSKSRRKTTPLSDSSLKEDPEHVTLGAKHKTDRRRNGTEKHAKSSKRGRGSPVAEELEESGLADVCAASHHKTGVLVF